VETDVRKVVIGLVLALAAALSAQADPSAVADFYRGKVVTLYVGYGPGGGFDVMGRLLARHMNKYLPGHPAFVVQNMPGAGSLLLANYLYNRAPADGTQFGIVARNLPLIALVGGDPNVRFDPRKFTWIGSSSDFSDDAYPLMVRKDSPVKTFADLRREGSPPLVIGGTAEGSSSADVPKILQDALGIRIKLILGYRDSAALFLAMEDAEIAGRMVELSSVRTTRPQWLEPGSDYRILLMYARKKRDPQFPDVPTAREVAPNAAARELIEFTESPLLSMAWPFVAPPGVPADRAAALQDAFMATSRDPDYLADAARLKVPIEPVSAAEISRDIDKLSKASPQVFDYVRKLMVTKRSGG
jgi:tripartite-type tricarboxylate transporter receptor subunit TctC